MATGSTNAAGKAEPLRKIDTAEVKVSEWLKEVCGWDVETADDFLATMGEWVNRVDMSAWVLDETAALYGYESNDRSYTIDRILYNLATKILPEAVAVGDEVKALYGLEEADINQVLKTIVETTIPNAIEKAVGDAMGGEY